MSFGQSAAGTAGSPGRRHHAIHYVELRDHAGRAGHLLRGSQLDQRLRAAGVVGVGVSVDEVAHRARRERANRGHDFRRELAVVGIHQQDSVVARFAR